MRQLDVLSRRRRFHQLHKWRLLIQHWPRAYRYPNNIEANKDCPNRQNERTKHSVQTPSPFESPAPPAAAVHPTITQSMEDEPLEMLPSPSPAPPTTTVNSTPAKGDKVISVMKPIQCPNRHRMNRQPEMLS